MPRSTPRLVVLLLAAGALTGCAGLSDAPRTVAVPDKPQPQAAVANDIEGNLRQAKLLRAAGSYDDAIHILSQLMLAAADDPRVVSEYGKALAQKGRAQDATQFLRRAIELSPGDWTLYSALGVSYDQLGDQANARLAYEHALMLRPNEASVLNNYALSRMLAKDPDGARALIARAQTAAGAHPNAKIARNVALIDDMAPQKAAAAQKPVAVAAAPKPAPRTAAAAKTTPKLADAAPQPPVAVPPAASKPTGPRSASDVARLLASQNPVANATAAPRPLAAQVAAAQPMPQNTSGVVMQAVPYDPYAGPVARKKPKTVAQADTHKADTHKAKPEQTAAAKPGVVPQLRVAAGDY
jgi:Flp pilus assembly protein TadD